MKLLFTLVQGTLLIALFTNPAAAQLQQSFDNASISNNCWSFSGYFFTTESGEVISGNSSLYSNPPTNSSSTRDIITPYLNVSSNTFTAAFNYKFSNRLNGQASRTIEVGLLNSAGAFELLDRFRIDASTPNHTVTNTYNKTFNVASTGIRRFVLRLGGELGDGNNRLILDDFNLSASPLYGTGTCNQAPQSASDAFYGITGRALSNGSVLANDSDPDKEPLTAVLVRPSSDGTLTLDPNGNFTFTPNSTFTGSSTTFTYRAQDNGYEVRQSGETTVTLYFVEPQLLPLRLTSFEGALQNNKAVLQWTIADNKDASHFEVQRSTDGVSFITTGLIMATEGKEQSSYMFTEKPAAGSEVHYRLKLWSKDGSFIYSKVLALRKVSATTAQPLQLWQSSPNMLNLKYSGATAHNMQLVVVNLSGMVLHRQALQCSGGNNSASITLAQPLKSGVYLVQLRNEATVLNGRLLVP